MGTFAEVLSRAVDARGLSLERIQHRLELRGVQVSLSTLSYWRRGRSRPERPESLNAVVVLGEILRLAPGELTGNLGDRRPRGRRLDRVLRAGDTALADLVFTSDPGAESGSAHRRFIRDFRGYVLDVEFHPDAVPPRCGE